MPVIYTHKYEKVLERNKFEELVSMYETAVKKIIVEARQEVADELDRNQNYQPVKTHEAFLTYFTDIDAIELRKRGRTGEGNSR